MERYEYIIEIGKSTPLIDESQKKEENLIAGCQSKVWLHSEIEGDTLTFTADSDAILTKGIVGLLLRVFNHQTPKEILEANTDFIDKIGLKEHLSPTRANGLVSMIKQIKLYALAFQSKLS
jgi:cysteine desulfuration protein SufE